MTIKKVRRLLVFYGQQTHPFKGIKVRRNSKRDDACIQRNDLIGYYKTIFRCFRVKNIRHPENLLLAPGETGLSHCHNMLNRMGSFTKEERLDKARRWLGFIQGVLLANGISWKPEFTPNLVLMELLGAIQGFLWQKKVYTLAELKEHSKPGSRF